MSLGSISGFGGASAIGAAGSGDLAGLGTNDLLVQLLDLINKSTAAPSSTVAISDAATSALQGGTGSASTSAGASMAEISQALIVALMLQLLQP